MLRLSTLFVITLTLEGVLGGAPSLSKAMAAPIWPGEAQVELKNMVARVIIVPEVRQDVDVKVRYGAARVPALLVSHKGDTIIVNGQMDIKRAHSDRPLSLNIADSERYKNQVVVVPGYLKVKWSDVPIVYIRIPNKARIKDNAFVVAQVEPSDSLDIIACGQGVWSIDTVKKNLSIVSCGAADFHIAQAQQILISASGTGNVHIQSGRSVKANLTGTGDLTLQSADAVTVINSGAGDVFVGDAQAAVVKLFGTGDMRLQRVKGPLDIESSGSADIFVHSLAGPAKINATGSGDIHIENGQVPIIDIKSFGSGDVRFNGLTETVTVESYGSGDVRIKRVSGKVTKQVRGSGDTYIGQ